jgi:hypothetical protein
VQHNDQIVWFSGDGAHQGQFDPPAPTTPGSWSGAKGEPSNPLSVFETAPPGGPTRHFRYVATVDGVSDHSEVIVVGPF